MKWPKKDKPKDSGLNCVKCAHQIKGFAAILGDGKHCTSCKSKIFILKNASR